MTQEVPEPLFEFLATPSYGIKEENGFPELVFEMMSGAARIRGGYLYGSDGPGVGIGINEEIAEVHWLVDQWRPSYSASTSHALPGLPSSFVS